ncbi:MAG: potassium transporter TrkG, partial [Bacteroidota bacterium]
MIKKQLHRFAAWISILGILAFIVDFGFWQSPQLQNYIDNFYFFVLGIGVVSAIVRYNNKPDITGRKRLVFVFDVLSVLFTLLLFGIRFGQELGYSGVQILGHSIWIKIAVVLAFIRESSELSIQYRRRLLKPSQLFVLSFLVVIIIGMLLLKLPSATYEGISFVDALFTSTSAVCVTGLIVVDTGTYFTRFGQVVIMLLIQVGGLGILTFASYFSYFFRGGSTYENQFFLS